MSLAVAASTQSGTRVEILPGLDGIYPESVVVDRGQQFVFLGLDPLSLGRTITIDGGSGPAFDVVTTAGTSRHRLENLVLRGGTGIRAAVGTELAGITLEAIPGVGLDLDSGNHEAERVRWTSTVQHGIGLASGASLTLRRSRFEDIGGTAATLLGAVTFENVLIGSPGSGLVVGATGSATLRHVTLANGSGIGVDASSGGTVSIAFSVLWGNVGGDLVGVPCANVSWSDVGTVNCTPGTGNLQADPTFVGGMNYHVLPGSPILDAGPAPAEFAANPCLDLDGGPRQRDWDGDGYAHRDLGAYEHADGSLSPGEVTGLTWTGKTALSWIALPGHLGEYHVYRDALASLSYAHFVICRDDLDGNRTDLQLLDSETPAPGAGYSYLITADAGGEEGTLGYGRCTERSNFEPCP